MDPFQQFACVSFPLATPTATLDMLKALHHVLAPWYFRHDIEQLSMLLTEFPFMVTLVAYHAAFVGCIDVLEFLHHNGRLTDMHLLGDVAALGNSVHTLHWLCDVLVSAIDRADQRGGSRVCSPPKASILPRYRQFDEAAPSTGVPKRRCQDSHHTERRVRPK
ncbi:Aste57867_9733 [Aphanomyces stellatus]|uniref:Aste57867_9733 protein n=1 Tax=Aphanomyces stellatus TaxID=120398 RepID=A0A485KNM5_9STRA|nr:hypothetical protein As57867_009695 [Aphanomyces stellatus]VFT86612.1 Aste57867_9733 [Aphanomyces stellatus]